MELQKDIKKSLKTKVFESLGEASMCWSETPKGVFDSNNAERIGNELLEFIDNIGRTYVIDTKVLPDNFYVNEFLKGTARQVYMVNAHEAIDTREPTLQEAIKILQKHFKPKGDSSKGLPSQILNSEKLSILKSIANSGGIDWNEVNEGDRIISLELTLFR